jgi:hypothetical protein
MFWIILFVFAVFCYVLWTAIHELSHVLMARLLVGISYWEINLIPKIKEAKLLRIQFASCFYIPLKRSTKQQQAAISLAPRIPDVLGAIALPFVSLMPAPISYFMMVFFGSALVDLFVGSIGMSEESDLRKAAENIDLSPWTLRLMGACIIIGIVFLTLKNIGWIQ